MSGAIPPLPQYALMAWCSVKEQGQLYLSLPLPVREIPHGQLRLVLRCLLPFKSESIVDILKGGGGCRSTDAHRVLKM
jgi:hypothetical protein